MSANTSTFAAALTAPAPGAIAVIAITGIDAVRVVQRIIKQPRSDAAPPITVAQPKLVRIVDSAGTTLDDAMLIVSPRADIEYVELQPHGGVRVVERVLELLAEAGATVIDPDHFANDYLCTNNFERDLHAALLQSTSRRLTAWLFSQATILPAFLHNWHAHSTTEKDAYLKRTQIAIRLVNGMRVALVGPPNAGKSTLANRLIGKNRIITSDVAGTTRDWVDEAISIDGWPLTLIDTAGSHDTTDPLEATAIARGQAQAQSADLVIHLMEADANAATDSFKKRDRTRNDQSAAVLRVMNKIDRLSPMQLDSMNRAVGTDSLFISATDGVGIETLVQNIVSQLGLDLLSPNTPTGFCSAHAAPLEAYS